MRDSTTVSLRLLIVDDHPVVREGLRSMLAGTAIDVVGEAGTAAEAIRLGAEAAPDVVLLDLGLPDLDGLSTITRLKQARPPAAVLVLTMHDDPALVRGAVQAGAAGYVLKGVSRQELLAAVDAVTMARRCSTRSCSAHWPARPVRRVARRRSRRSSTTCCS